jgi:hypothetical protein
VPHILSHHPRCGRRTRSFVAFAETRATNGGRPHPLRSLTSGYRVPTSVPFHGDDAARFRGEFFNNFNHPNFGPPDDNITDPLFGHSIATLPSSLGSSGVVTGASIRYIKSAVRVRSNSPSSLYSEQFTVFASPVTRRVDESSPRKQNTNTTRKTAVGRQSCVCPDTYLISPNLSCAPPYSFPTNVI